MLTLMPKLSPFIWFCSAPNVNKNLIHPEVADKRLRIDKDLNLEDVYIPVTQQGEEHKISQPQQPSPSPPVLPVLQSHTHTKTSFNIPNQRRFWFESLVILHPRCGWWHRLHVLTCLTVLCELTVWMIRVSNSQFTVHTFTISGYKTQMNLNMLKRFEVFSLWL